MKRSLLPLAGIIAAFVLSAWLIFGIAGVVVASAAVFLIGLATPRIPLVHVMRFHGARPINPARARSYYAWIGELSERAGLAGLPRLYYMPSAVPNAFTIGDAEDSAIAVSEGLLRILNRRELAGVLAHEVAHIAAGDVGIMRVCDHVRQATSLVCSLGVALIACAWLLNSDGEPPLLTMLLLGLMPTGIGVLQLSLSRSREFEADDRAASLTGDPSGLASALHKIEAVSRWTLRRALGRAAGLEVPDWLRTHPATEDRIVRLQSLDSTPIRTREPARPARFGRPVAVRRIGAAF